MIPRYLGEGPANVVVETWRDDDADGVWDTTESALPFTQVFANDLTRDYGPLGITTNADGRGVFDFWPMDWVSGTYEFYPETPSGYQLVTPEQVQLDISEMYDNVVRFGFALLPGQPAPTPIPRAELTCQQIIESGSENDYIDVSRLQSGPDGSMVVTLTDRPEMLHYSADGAFLATLPLAPERRPDRLAFAPDGSYWMAGRLLSDGLARFDGGEWRVFDPFEHPGTHDVNSITPAPNGDVWLGTDIGAFQLDEATGEWSRFAAYRSICDVMPAIDGTIWLLACDWSLVRLAPGGPRQYEGSEVARMSDPQLTHGNLLGAVLEDTGVWLLGSNGLAWWERVTAEWTVYTPATTGNALPPYYITGFTHAADGALWLVTPKEGLIHARPKEGEWTLVHAPVLFGYPDEVRQLVRADDGSIWLTTGVWDTVYRCER